MSKAYTNLADCRLCFNVYWTCNMYFLSTFFIYYYWYTHINLSKSNHMKHMILHSHWKTNQICTLYKINCWKMYFFTFDIISSIWYFIIFFVIEYGSQSSFSSSLTVGVCFLKLVCLAIVLNIITCYYILIKLSR